MVGQIRYNFFAMLVSPSQYAYIVTYTYTPILFTKAWFCTIEAKIGISLTMDSCFGLSIQFILRKNALHVPQDHRSAFWILPMCMTSRSEFAIHLRRAISNCVLIIIIIIITTKRFSILYNLIVGPDDHGLYCLETNLTSYLK